MVMIDDDVPLCDIECRLDIRGRGGDELTSVDIALSSCDGLLWCRFASPQ